MKTILLIEDEKMVLSFLYQMLEIMDCEVIPFLNGKEGLDYFNKNHEEIGLVITDLIMPGMSGIDVIKIIRKSSSDMKVILITGALREKIEEDVKEYGNVKVLSKPFSKKDLEDVLNGLCDER